MVSDENADASFFEEVNDSLNFNNGNWVNAGKRFRPAE